MKTLNNVVKCSCGKYLQYDKHDIIKKECSYSVQTYAGETYMGNFIKCPNCGREIEIY